MTTPLFSIGLPCYNAAATLPATIRSIVAQTCSDWELVAVDDGSTDGTGALLAGIEDSRVRAICDPVNRGLPYRLNQTVREARGKYFVRMDADDLMFPDRLERQLVELEAHPDANIVGGGMVCIDMKDEPLTQRFAPTDVRDPYRILAGEVVYHPTVAGSAEWFKKNPYSEELSRSEDFELWARNAGSLTIRNVQAPLIFYREFGTTDYAKLRLYSSITQDVLRQYGPSSIGAGKTRGLIARRKVKDTVYGALHYSGLWKTAIRLRSTPLGAADRDGYRKVLEQIAGTDVPGLS
jgi:glycosyltransferase involved in cell wall biosynthesis